MNLMMIHSKQWIDLIGILRSMLYRNLEYDHDHDHDISSVFNMYENNERNNAPYKIPRTVGYKILVNDSWIATPMNTIMEYISKNSVKYGYAVINLHPHDIMIQNKTGKLTTIENKTEVGNLANLVNNLISKNIAMT